MALHLDSLLCDLDELHCVDSLLRRRVRDDPELTLGL